MRSRSALLLVVSALGVLIMPASVASAEEKVVEEEQSYELSGKELEENKDPTGALKLTAPSNVNYNADNFEKGSEKFVKAGVDSCSNKLVLNGVLCEVGWEWQSAGAVAGKVYTDTLAITGTED